MIFNCKKYTTAYARGEFEGATGIVRFMNKLHMFVCQHCFRFTKQLRLIAAAIRGKAMTSVDETELKDFKKRLVKDLSK